jgi:hypothetical protein
VKTISREENNIKRRRIGFGQSIMRSRAGMDGSRSRKVERTKKEE